MVMIVQTDKDVSLQDAGGKGLGLLRMKGLEAVIAERTWGVKAEVPPFFIVPPTVDLGGSLQQIREHAQNLGVTLFSCRSSSSLEDVSEHSFDGVFETVHNIPLEKLPRAIHTIRKSALSDKARRYTSEKGVELTHHMPVIVQATVVDPAFTGIVYSKFPCPHDVAKMVREDRDGRLIDVYARHEHKDCYDPSLNGKKWVLDSNPLVRSKDWQEFDMGNRVPSVAVALENELGHPVIFEFAYSIGWRDNPKEHEMRKFADVKMLQARKLTHVSDATKFVLPRLQEKGFVTNTHDLNGVGDVTAKAYVFYVNHRDTDMWTAGRASGDQLGRLQAFDRDHPQGYVLVTPYMQFDYSKLDDFSPHKKAVVAYTRLGHHHDMEVSRKKGILYLNVEKGNIQFYNDEKRHSIETGETVRVVSDGLEGFLYNLSRQL